MGRPILQAVAAQQQQIAVLAQQNDMLRAEVIVLKSQLHALATTAGFDGEMDGIRSVALKHIEADMNNPAQPIEDPASEPAFQTTEDALNPDTRDNVMNPGMTPGSVNNLAADGHDTPYTPGTSMDTPAFNQLQDPTRPVAGTEGPLPLDQVRTETDVRVGDPNNPQVAFPLTPAFSSNRTMASIRLARLQIEAGIEQGDDLSLGERIASSNLSDETIDAQITTLASVRKAASRQRPAGVVPRAAGVARTTPSLTSEASLQAEAAADGSTDEDLFLD